MTTKLPDYKDAPTDFAVCTVNGCLMCDNCLRYIVGETLPDRVMIHNAVMPGAMMNGQCQMFLEPRREILAWGMKDMYAGIEWYHAQMIRKELRNDVFGEAQYYRYRNGQWPITPEIQDKIAAVLRKYGYNDAPHFDRVEEQWMFE